MNAITIIIKKQKTNKMNIISNIITNLDKYYKDLDYLQSICKHKHKQTIYNVGSYALRVKCIDCNKILKFKFIK